jgi:hypothetical protein
MKCKLLATFWPGDSEAMKTVEDYTGVVWPPVGEVQSYYVTNGSDEWKMGFLVSTADRFHLLICEEAYPTVGALDEVFNACCGVLQIGESGLLCVERRAPQ